MPRKIEERNVPYNGTSWYLCMYDIYGKCDKTEDSPWRCRKRVTWRWRQWTHVSRWHAGSKRCTRAARPPSSRATPPLLELPLEHTKPCNHYPNKTIINSIDKYARNIHIQPCHCDRRSAFYQVSASLNRGRHSTRRHNSAADGTEPLILNFKIPCSSISFQNTYL